jgi:hypothetical protein
LPLASQQPVGHEAALQTHAPPTQALPVPHAGPEPQPQVPPAQLSAVRGSQVVQAAPPVPQEPVAGVLQTLPLQQPEGQLAALHTQVPPTQAEPAAHAAPPPQEQLPPLQVSLAPHAMQDEPLSPQAAVVLVVQVSPAQQPVGQLVESQTHLPPRQRCPLPHAALAPQ